MPLAAQRLTRRRGGGLSAASRGAARWRLKYESISPSTCYTVCIAYTYTHLSSLRLLLPKAGSRGGEVRAGLTQAAHGAASHSIVYPSIYMIYSMCSPHTYSLLHPAPRAAERLPWRRGGAGFTQTLIALVQTRVYLAICILYSMCSPHINSCLQPAPRAAQRLPRRRGGGRRRLSRGAARRLAFTRHCHNQCCMVHGIQKEGRWGGVYGAMVVQ